MTEETIRLVMSVGGQADVEQALEANKDAIDNLKTAYQSGGITLEDFITQSEKLSRQGKQLSAVLEGIADVEKKLQAQMAATAQSGYDLADSLDKVSAHAASAERVALRHVGRLDEAKQATTRATLATNEFAEEEAHSNQVINAGVGYSNRAMRARLDFAESQRKAAEASELAGNGAKMSAYKMQQFGQTVDDLQYVGEQGLRPILNNITELSPMLGVALIAVDMLWRHFKDLTGEEKTAADRLEELKTKAADLSNKPIKMAVDYAELKQLTAELDRIEERKKVLEATKQGTDEEAFKKETSDLISTYGGGSEQMTKDVSKALGPTGNFVHGDKDNERYQFLMNTHRRRLKMGFASNLWESEEYRDIMARARENRDKEAANLVADIGRGDEGAIRRIKGMNEKAPQLFDHTGSTGVSLSEAIANLPGANVRKTKVNGQEYEEKLTAADESARRVAQDRELAEIDEKEKDNLEKWKKKKERDEKAEKEAKKVREEAEKAEVKEEDEIAKTNQAAAKEAAKKIHERINKAASDADKPLTHRIKAIQAAQAELSDVGLPSEEIKKAKEEGDKAIKTLRESFAGKIGQDVEAKVKAEMLRNEALIAAGAPIAGSQKEYRQLANRGVTPAVQPELLKQDIARRINNDIRRGGGDEAPPVGKEIVESAEKHMNEESARVAMQTATGMGVQADNQAIIAQLYARSQAELARANQVATQAQGMLRKAANQGPTGQRMGGAR